MLIQKIVESDPNADCDGFIGLGMKLEEEGFSENEGYEWY
jgi:hypothetical protein